MHTFISVSFLFTLAFSLNAAFEKLSRFENHDYLFVFNKLSYEMAKEYCASRNQVLLSLDSAEEKKFIDEQFVLKNKAQGWWVDMKIFANCEPGSWSKLVDGKCDEIVNFCRPKQPYTRKDCVLFRNNLNCMDIVNCSQANRFVCEDPKPSDGPSKPLNVHKPKPHVKKVDQDAPLKPLNVHKPEPHVKKVDLDGRSKPLNIRKPHAVSNVMSGDVFKPKPETKQLQVDNQVIKENGDDKDDINDINKTKTHAYCMEMNDCDCHYEDYLGCDEQLETIRAALKEIFTFAFSHCHF